MVCRGRLPRVALMHKDKLERTRKLGRFRKLAEDKAAIALQSATQRANVAQAEREQATERVDAVSRWKALVGDNASLQVATYEQALELEDVAMSAEREAIDEERRLGEQRDTVAESYREAMNAARVVDRRQQRLLHESQAHRERVEMDAVSDLWLARSIHSDA